MERFSKISLLLIILLFSFSSFALETEWQDSSAKKEGSIRLVSAGYDDYGKVISGLHMKFSGNWHTYWKRTGDSGMSVTPDFSKSENIRATEMLWPVPKRELFFDLEGWVYGKEVILPLSSEVIDPTKPAKIVANVKWAICDEDCIFVENTIEQEIPVGYKSAETLAEIDEYILRTPQDIVENNDIKLTKLEASDKTVVAKFGSVLGFKDDIDLFLFEESKNFRFPKPTIVFSDDKKNVTITTNYEVLKKGETLAGKNLEFTLRNGDGGVVGTVAVSNDDCHPEQQKTEGFERSRRTFCSSGLLSKDDEQKVLRQSGKPEGLPLAQDDSFVDLSTVNRQLSTTLLQAIIYALLGGLILNIMPCVLPIIMLKIFGVIKHGSNDKKYIRKSFSYTIVGIIFSFLLIATFIVILKSLGHTIGWGIQFQQPVFLVFMSVLLSLFAANQFGWFEINLHTKISDKINDKLNHAGDATPLGNFLTGAFATLLATPCTAPFLGVAISFAFTASSLKIFFIFFFMGIGLAIPYILIMISPSLVKIFPRPGRWMNTVRTILGIFLIAANFWIFWVFFNNCGMNAGFMLVVCTFLMMLWIFVSHRLKLDRTKTFFTILWMALWTAVITLYLSGIEREPEVMKGRWSAFNRAEIDADVAAGKLVFVDVTADWCLTCKFNKANVTYPMKPFFDENKVIMMKADYTRTSKQVSDYLEEWGSYAIPLNIVYGPNAPEGIKLPVILKEQHIKDAVERAR